LHVNGRWIGPTPKAVTLPGSESCTLRLSLPNCRDWTLTVAPGQVIGTDIHGELVSNITGTVRCRSVPAGANVIVDGEPYGKTPLDLTDMPLGTLDIRYELTGYTPQQSTVTITDRGPERDLAITLQDRTVGFYRERIEQDPDNTTHYTDLAHHLFVTGRLAEGCDVLAEGFMVMTRQKQKDSRLLAEFQKTLSAQYFLDVPTSDVKQMLLEKARGQMDDIAKPTADHLHGYIGLLMALGERKLAMAETELALSFFPDDEDIQSVSKALQRQIRKASTPPVASKELTAATQRYMDARAAYSKHKAQLIRVEKQVASVDAQRKSVVKQIEASRARIENERTVLVQTQTRLDELAASATALADRRKALTTGDAGNERGYQAARKALITITDEQRTLDAEIARAQAAQAKREAVIAQSLTAIQRSEETLTKLAGLVEKLRPEVEEAERLLVPVAEAYGKAKAEYLEQTGKANPARKNAPTKKPAKEGKKAARADRFEDPKP